QTATAPKDDNKPGLAPAAAPDPAVMQSDKRRWVDRFAPLLQEAQRRHDTEGIAGAAVAVEHLHAQVGLLGADLYRQLAVQSEIQLDRAEAVRSLRHACRLAPRDLTIAND